VVINRTTGEASARCHDLEANSLALNLMHDIVTGTKTWQQARAYYAKEVLDYRRKLPTPTWTRSGSRLSARPPLTPTLASCLTKNSRGPARPEKRGSVEICFRSGSRSRLYSIVQATQFFEFVESITDAATDGKTVRCRLCSSSPWRHVGVSTLSRNSLSFDCAGTSTRSGLFETDSDP
jgi:hypothetical protein